MTTPQILSFAIIAAAITAFASGRFRYDLVSLVALLAAVTVGIVPIKSAFTGFTSDVVIIIASALIVSAAVARSGVLEATLGPLLGRLKTLPLQVPALAGATALLSIVTKNVGALAILMPTAIRLGRTEGSSVSAMLMPMSFMSLLGGLVTLVGTSTNIIVSQVRQDTFGKPFRMFDFAPVGLCLTLLGFVVVSFGWRLLPRNRQGREKLEDSAAAGFYSTEATVKNDLPADVRTISDLDLGKDKVKLVSILRGNGRHIAARARSKISPGDVLLLEGEDEALASLFARAPLLPARANKDLEKDKPNEEIRSIEVVVQPDSPLVGASAQSARLQDSFGVKLLAINRRNHRITQRLRDVRARAGDVLLLQAGENAFPDFVRSLCLLPLAERAVKLGSPRQRYGPIAILSAAILLIAFNVVPVVAGFFGAAVLIVVIGALPMREAYNALDAGNLSAYIPTNLISITDGQIVLDAKLFYQGQKPAVDVGISVSRVGGKTQAHALRDAAQTLRLDYAQFLELEAFTRFGGMPDTRVRQQLTRGARIRAILDQTQHAPLRLAEEVALVMAAQGGLLDALPIATIPDFRKNLGEVIDRDASDAVRMIQDEGELDDAGKKALRAALDAYAKSVTPADPDNVPLP